MKTTFTAAILGAVLCGGALHGAEPRAGLLNSREHRLMSKAVGCEYVIQVRLPDSYDKGDARYPVVYVLDGDIVFGLASDVATQLPRRKDGPEVIVVGVAYGGTVDLWWNTRARDLTPACRNAPVPKEFPNAGGAQKFQDFLATELIPFVESRYRTRDGDRTLVGYSLGGTFAMHTLFTRPELFQRYVIVSPGLGWDKKQIFETEEQYHAQNARLPASVFVACGEKESPGPPAIFLRFSRQVESRHYEGLRWMSQVFPDETHMSIYPVAFTHGLKAVHSSAAPAGAASPADLTEKQQAAIRQEVIATVQGMFAAEGRLDPHAVWTYHADVPGYRWADIDGQFYDYAGARKVWIDYIANCTKLTSATAHEEVMVLGPDLAFYLWQGTVEATQKDGAVSRNEVWTARYLCRRINGAWKIIGGQESSAPPHPARSTQGAVDDTAAVKQFAAELDRCSRAADLDAFMNQMVADVVFLPPDQPAVEGAAAVREWYKGLWSAVAIEMKHHVAEVQTAGDLVVARGTAKGTTTPRAGGAQAAFDNKFLFVLKRAPDGSLKAWRVIFNSNAPATPAAD